MIARSLPLLLLATLLLAACSGAANTVPLPAARFMAITTTPSRVSSSPTPARPTVQPTTGSTTQAGDELLFLRSGALVALNLATRHERVLAQDVRDFAATPDGRLLALVRGAGRAANLWRLQRDGSGLRQLTADNRADGSPAFAPDGLSLVYASSTLDAAPGRTWNDWSLWCRASEVRVLALSGGTAQTLGKGCDPTFAPDGRRIAFAAPPRTEVANMAGAGAGNAIRLVNRRGQNGWSFALAGDDTQPQNGLLVYAPAFNLDGQRLAYQRFIGYRALVDMDYTQIGSSFSRQNHQALEVGAGWLFAPRFAPGGLVAVSQYNYSDARGWEGYELWRVSVLRTPGQREVPLPDGNMTLASSEVATLPRAQAAAWSPDGRALAVQLPPGWSANAATGEPIFTEERPGELWLWTPGQAPTERLAANVDFASPLLWLPAPPLLHVSAQGYQLATPADWKLRVATEFEERTADGPAGSVMSAAPTASATVPQMFPNLVAAGAKELPAIAWPDGSSYREWSGTSPEGKPIAGAVRIVRRQGVVVAIIYRAATARWPQERALAQSLLAASGLR